MKKNTHPEYQQVLFVDSTTGRRFVIGSALQPAQKEVFEGVEYPVYHLSTSSYSHPLFTGSKQLVDAEGRVDKFKKRYIAAQQKGNAISSQADSEKENEKKEEPKTKAKTKAKVKK
jgi:large subunit ribosomal protein L31